MLELEIAKMNRTTGECSAVLAVMFWRSINNCKDYIYIYIAWEKEDIAIS